MLLASNYSEKNAARPYRRCGKVTGRHRGSLAGPALGRADDREGRRPAGRGSPGLRVPRAAAAAPARVSALTGPGPAGFADRVEPDRPAAAAAAHPVRRDVRARPPGIGRR